MEVINENKITVIYTIVKILSQHKKWLDIRHMYTLVWMVVGLIKSEKISLTAWVLPNMLKAPRDGCQGGLVKVIVKKD